LITRFPAGDAEPATGVDDTKVLNAGPDPGRICLQETIDFSGILDMSGVCQCVAPRFASLVIFSDTSGRSARAWGPSIINTRF
jgi:hypothetical protein